MQYRDISSVYDIECTDLAGKPLPLQQYSGQPILVVNTASLCGFSSQFKGLEEIWQDYKSRGLVVLGVPSNEFGHQEPGASAQIMSLCTAKFGITFPLLAKTLVSGPSAHPLFQFLAHEGGFFAKPRWNFYKYIIGRNGHLKSWFSSLANPQSLRFNRAIMKSIEDRKP